MSERPLKIAVFHHVPAGGAKRALYNFAKELARRGHQVDYFGMDTYPDKLFSLPSVAKASKIYPAPRWRPLKIKPYVLSLYVILIQRVFFFLRLNRLYARMAAEIDQGGYDFVFIHNCLYTQAPFLLRHLKTLRIYYAHEPLRWIYEPGLEPLEKPRGIWKWISYMLCWPAKAMDRQLSKCVDRRNILSADHIITNSYYTCEAVYRAYGVLSTVSSPGVETELFRPLNLERKNFVLSIGSIAPAKKHDFVIESLALVEPNIRPSLVVVGNVSSGDFVQKIKDQAQRLGVKLEIKLLISDEELVRLYNEAQAVVYPPLMEPFGLVPLEAMSCGTPVIGVKEGGIRETIIDGETGIHVSRDPKECAAAITRILTDSSFARRLSQDARDYACRKWCWSVCVDELERKIQKFT